jgi:hypothetical protein
MGGAMSVMNGRPVEYLNAASAAVHAKSLKPTRDCNDEASAMVLQIPMVP